MSQVLQLLGLRKVSEDVRPLIPDMAPSFKRSERVLMFNKYETDHEGLWHYSDSAPLRAKLCPRTCM